MKEISLRELCKSDQIGKYGIPAAAEDFSIDKMRYLRISDIDDNGNLLSNDKKSVSSDEIEKYILKEGDIVFARTGNSTGRTYYHEDKNGVLAYAGFLIKYGLDELKVHPKYLKYFTLSEKYRQWVKNLSVGSTRGNINAQTFANCPILLPERHQQEALVSILSTLDDKIELNNRINAELEQMAKTLYDYWFVQFDFPDANGNPYKSSGGKMVYDEVLKRKIPEGWKVKRLGATLKTFLGGTPSTKIKKYWQGNIPWMNSGEVANFPLISTEQKISEEAIANSSTKLMRKGSVLLSITRHLRVNILGIDACINQSIAGIEESKIFKNSYIYFSILNDIDRLMSLRTGAQQPHINKEIVDDSPFIIADGNVLEQYYQKTNPLFERIVNIAQQNHQLAALRDWLLPMLMNGQVKVVDETKEYNAVEEQPALAAEPQTTYGELPILNIPASRKNFARQVLAGKIVSEFKDDPNFTEIKFQKIQFLAEHIIDTDLKLNYYYQAAGPYDNVFMHTIYNDFRKQKWFDCKNKQILTLEKQGKIEEYYQGYFAPAQEQLDKLFGLLYQTTEAEAEIIATLYAAWNNRIIEKRTITDRELIQDFYQWSDRKRQYSEVQITEGLQWLRRHRMEPRGFGRLIRKAKRKEQAK